MSKRISHSLLDPFIGPPIKRLYPRLHIPRWFPPEGIIPVGHLSAIGGAVGFAFSTDARWGGVLAAAGVAGNHVADCLDGTHARSTGQCRNGGELLDHFTDPLSFAYWLVGMYVSIQRLDLALAAVIILFATAVLTNIKSKMIGEFTLATFGPTEFKSLLVLYGLAQAFTVSSQLAFWFLIALLVVGAVQLLTNLIGAVRQVNAHGAAPDTSEWETTREKPGT